MTPERCADACARRGDPLGATAPPVLFWLLVEQPGPWGPTALTQSGLPGEVADHLARKGAEWGARVMLIRKPGRDAGGPRRWAWVDSRPGRERSWWSTFDDPADLLDLRRGAPSDDPIYLVCTHGRHDTCCAIRGRPVAAALAAARPGQVWECSHVGGDRFAANLIALPQGIYYGQVDDPVATALRHEAGEVDLPRLRGRAGFPAPTQAAQQFAREHLGVLGIDAVVPRGLRVVGDGQWEVDLDVPEGAVRVAVRATFSLSDTPLTCTAGAPDYIRRFELVSLRPL